MFQRQNSTYTPFIALPKAARLAFIAFMGWSWFFCFFILMTSCNGRKTEQDVALFRLVDPGRSGVNFSNEIHESPEFNIINYQDFYSGGGVSIGDVNNDGLPDLFFTGNMVRNRLYLNKGNLTFEDVTEESGMRETDYKWSSGSTMVDINNDGWLDIYVAYSGLLPPDQRRNKLWINNRDGTFTDEAGIYGLDDPGYAVNASFFDYDKDGDLDMYLVNQGPEKNPNFNQSSSRDIPNEYCGDKLYRNDSGIFTDVTLSSGIYSSLLGFGHGAAVGDVDGDGWDDLFVCNDFIEYDYLYINNQDGTFREMLKPSMKHISNFSMGNDMADFNNDGLLDIVAVDMVAEDEMRKKSMMSGMNAQLFNRAVEQGFHYQYMYNMLHLNNGNGSYSEIAHLSGISNTDWSWGPLFADFDGDGWKDLFVSNGLRKDIRNRDWALEYNNALDIYGTYELFPPELWQDLLTSLPSQKIKNYIYRNSGNLILENVTDSWGLTEPSFSNGAAYGDLDNDGDLDLVVNNVDDVAFIYENTMNERPGFHYLKIKLTGPATNQMAFGAKVSITTQSNRQLLQHYVTRGYRSSTDPTLIFGCGADSIINTVEVIWPDGNITKLQDIPSNQVLTIDYATAEKLQAVELAAASPIFQSTDSVPGISFHHEENPYDPYQIQALLPYRLSELGPEIAVADVNGDGLDDVFIGAAYGKPAGMFVQQKGGMFIQTNQQLFNNEKDFEDAGAAFFDADGDGDNDLYVASGGYEFAEGSPQYMDRLYLNDGKGNFLREADRLPAVARSSGKVRPFDYDGDGDMDIFINGRQVPQKYPASASSIILNNQNGYFSDVTLQVAPELINIGMVTDAVWSDVDKDNDPDLLLVGEWMNVVYMQNDQGVFKKVTGNSGLENSSGWWNCIIASDLDNDGDEDFIVGNFGLNSRFKAKPDSPLEVFSADFNKDGRYDLILAIHENGRLAPFENFKRSSTQIPELLNTIPNHGHFAVSALSDAYKEYNLDDALHARAVIFESSVIMNLGNGKFSMMPLPVETQISSVHSIIANDYDANGNVDLLIAGNRYGIEEETVRNDAGIGLFLRGDGKGNFQPVSVLRSGFFVDGDVKSMSALKIGNSNCIAVGRTNGPLTFIKHLPLQEKIKTLSP